MKREQKIARNHIRKSRMRKNLIKLISATMIFAAAIILVLLLGNNTVKTKASANQNGVKYYKSIMVKAGDSLWTIADRYMEPSEYVDEREYVNEIKQINKLDSDNITYGEHLIVSYYVYE